MLETEESLSDSHYPGKIPTAFPNSCEMKPSDNVLTLSHVIRERRREEGTGKSRS